MHTEKYTYKTTLAERHNTVNTWNMKSKFFTLKY